MKFNQCLPKNIKEIKISLEHTVSNHNQSLADFSK